MIAHAPSLDEARLAALGRRRAAPWSAAPLLLLPAAAAASLLLRVVQPRVA